MRTLRLELAVFTRRSTAALWRSARDAAALYVTVVKYAHKPKLAQVPRLGLLYYTDCMCTCSHQVNTRLNLPPDIAHEILFIGYAYKSQDRCVASPFDLRALTHTQRSAVVR